MPCGAAQRRVTVRPEQGLAGNGEGFHVHLVADAVAELGEDRAVAPRRRLHVAVVVGVARVHLVDVVVDVCHHPRRHHVGAPHGLELEQGHGRWCR
jgi:hypothetical protein